MLERALIAALVALVLVAGASHVGAAFDRTFCKIHHAFERTSTCVKAVR